MTSSCCLSRLCLCIPHPNFVGRLMSSPYCLCVSLSTNFFLIFRAVLVVSKESIRLVVPRTPCYVKCTGQWQF
jgi:hypothetical protein